MTEHYVIRCRSGLERQAAEHLAFWGVPAYFPKIAVIKISRRRPNSYAELCPAFPSYLFVEAGQQVFEAVERTELCYGVMYMNGIPFELPQSEIDRLIEAEKVWHKSPIIVKGRLLPGQTVRLTSGVLSGFLATVLASEPHTSRISINAPGKCGACISVPTRDLLAENLEPLANSKNSQYKRGQPLVFHEGFSKSVAGT